MTKDQIYDIWKPAESIWSPWVKAVLFSYMNDTNPQLPLIEIQPHHIPPAKNTAILLNLPGAQGVMQGLALAKLSGFRPVPLYNACPYATPPSLIAPLSITPNDFQPVPSVPCMVDVIHIMNALATCAKRLSAADLRHDAPPAFLVDEDRGRRNWSVNTNAAYFDNRSFLSESDVPSSEYLRQQGISQVLLIQKKPKLQPDLKRVLLAWQTGGLAIAIQDPTAPFNPQSIQIKPPNLIQRLINLLRPAKHPRDYFGDYVPPSSSS